MESRRKQHIKIIQEITHTKKAETFRSKTGNNIGNNIEKIQEIAYRDNDF